MKTLSRVAIVVGETSGDILAAGLIAEIKKMYPDCVFEGVGGPRMSAQGFIPHHPMERLAVMGLVEPLKRLPELLSIRKSLRKRYIENPPDLFIGVDAPDFNLSLELALRKSGITTVHYVSPSVWAWRQGRIKKITKAVDLMLTLFPFEADFYKSHKVNVKFVGHPLADKLPLEQKTEIARAQLGLRNDQRVLALLPGSRKSEIERLGQLFLDAAEICQQQLSQLTILIPAANAVRFEEIKTLSANYPHLDLKLSEGNSHDVMAAADVVVMASGTTTLEAMLLKKPMVIAYRMAALSFWLIKRMTKVRFVGLPNLLAGRELAPELLQRDATKENISRAVLNYFLSKGDYANTVQVFTDIHKSLKCSADKEAAKAVVALWQSKVKSFEKD